MLHLQRKRISFHFEAKLLTNSVEAILVPPFGKIRNGKWSFKKSNADQVGSNSCCRQDRLVDAKNHWAKVWRETGYLHHLKVSPQIYPLTTKEKTITQWRNVVVTTLTKWSNITSDDTSQHQVPLIWGTEKGTASFLWCSCPKFITAT